MLRSLHRSVGVVLLAAAVAAPALAEPPVVASTAVGLDPSDPGRNSLGKAIFRGGVVLASDDPRFGGWSDVLVAPDGTSLLAVGDQAGWLAATLQYDSGGGLATVVVTAMGQLKGLDGADLGAEKAMADAEALAWAPDGGYLVCFERNHRIWLYSPDLAGTPVQAPTPPAVLDLKPEFANEGVEAMARLPDGRVVMFLEGGEDAAGTLAYVQEGDGFTEMSYARQDGFQVVGAAPLADGGLMIAERFYSKETGSKIRLRRLPAEAIGKAVSAASLDLLLELAAPLTVDNIEGVGVWQDGNGATRVLLLSDDNFNRREQRTLLLDFELVD
jgi:hypothetical protein